MDSDSAVNDQSDTVETIVAQRRRMILTTADFAGYEVQRELDALRGGSGLAARLRQDPPAHQQALALAPDDLSAGIRAVGGRLLDRCRTDFESFVESQRVKPNDYFNQDEMFLRVMTDLLDYKDAALHKIRLYLADPSLSITAVEERSLKVVRRMLLAQLKDNVKAAKRAKDTDKVRESAGKLAKETGRLVQNVDEVIDGRSVLGAATEDGDAAGIALLIQAGANPSLADDCDGRTALALATELDDVDCVAALIKGGAEPDQANASDGATALHSAAQEGHVEIAEKLLAANARVDYEHNNGWRAIHYAALKGQAEIGRLLVEAGTDVEAPILDDNAMLTPLHLAASGGFEEMTSVLIEAKADVNAVDKTGNSALHMACAGGSTGVAKLLVDAGAETDVTNSDGLKGLTSLESPQCALEHATPLMLAAMGGHPNLCSALLAANADVGFKMEGHVTALHGACAGGHLGVAKLLLEANADPAVQVVAQESGLGGNAMEIAEQQGFQDLAKYLADLGSNKKAKKPARKAGASGSSVKRGTTAK